MRVQIAAFILLLLINARVGTSAPPAELIVAVNKPVLLPNQAIDSLRKMASTRLPPLPAAKSADDWAKSAEQLRSQILQTSVYRGAAAEWAKSPLRIEWLDEVPGGVGYRMKKLRYEALPGMWIPAILYVPEKITHKAPVFLNVNGHDPIGKVVDYKQLRCINLAKRGIICLNPEWFGMGQFKQPGYGHGRMNQLDLCGTSGLAPFYLSMKRGLDVLLSLEHADPTRVGVAGLSGGGWQTILISALDSRVTLSNPVAGYSSFITRGANFQDLGDSEQTPVDLGVHADYTHLTALMAPRATLLTYNLNDNCCFKADQALPPLLAAGRPFFRLFSRDDALQYHVNAEPGDHNFQLDNREALYRFVGQHFFADADNYPLREIKSEAELRTPAQFEVELPADNLNFNTVSKQLAADLPRRDARPSAFKDLDAWRRERRPVLKKVVAYLPGDARLEEMGQADVKGTSILTWRLRTPGGWVVPVVELTRGEPKGTTILLADRGRSALADTYEELLSQGQRVILVETLLTGESSIPNRDYLFALLISTVGLRPLGVEAEQIQSVVQWLKTNRNITDIHAKAVGRRMSLALLTTAALEPTSFRSIRLTNAVGSLHEPINQSWSVEEAPEYFCFGLLEEFDLSQLGLLAAPCEVSFDKPSESVIKEFGLNRP